MAEGVIGAMLAPGGGSNVPPGTLYGCDNGRFGKGWPGHAEWILWVRRRVERFGVQHCLFAVAPDVPMNAVATLDESLPWLCEIRDIGIPAAFAAQDGSEASKMIPWDAFDVLFLGGSTSWKIGPEARSLASEAMRRGKAVHMGRVNSGKRFRLAREMGCQSVDGTFLAFGPNKNLPRLMKWLA